MPYGDDFSDDMMSDYGSPAVDRSDQSANFDYTGGTANMPVAEVGAGQERIAPPTQDGQHVLTIRQGGRDERYRYDNGVLNQRDEAMGQRLLQYAQEKARQVPFSQGDALRLQRLNAGRVAIEEQIQNGQVNDQDGFAMLSMVNSGASVLEARRELTEEKRKNAVVRDLEQKVAVGTVQAIRKAGAIAGTVPLRTIEIPTPDGGSVVHTEGVDGKYSQHLIPGPDLGKLYEKHKKALTKPDPTDINAKRMIEPSEEQVQEAMETELRVTEKVKKAERERRHNPGGTNVTPASNEAPAATAPNEPVAQPGAPPQSKAPPIPKELAQIRSAREETNRILAKREAEESAAKQSKAEQDRQKTREIEGGSLWGGRYR